MNTRYGYTCKGGNCQKSKFFLLTVDAPFSERKAYRNVQKWSPLYKWQKNYQVYSVH